MGLLATAAHGDEATYVSSGAAADGDSVRIHCTVLGSTRLADRSLVVEARLLGDCEDVAVVTPVALPIAADDAEQHFVFTIRPALAGRVYFYKARLVDGAGNLASTPGSVIHPNGSYVSCGEGLIARGLLNTWLCSPAEFPCFLACADQCWAACPTNIAFPLDTAAWAPYVNSGVVVDLYGTVARPWSLWDMPGTPCMEVTRIAPVTGPAGCAALAQESTSWGAVKARYR